MSDTPTPEETARWQRRLAAQANNRAWALADRPSRTADEDEEMLQAAHAAMHFWNIVGDDSNRAHAAQLVAHACALAGLPGPAQRYLARSQPFFLESPCAPWEVAYAHLVAAGVAAAAGDAARHRDHHRRARQAIDALADPEERGILEASMRVVPAPAS